MINTVKHGGALGDIIYGLWALKRLGGCKTLLISSRNMTPDYYKFIKPLLERQSYIGKVKFIEEYNGYSSHRIDIDMDVYKADVSRYQITHIAQNHVNMLNRIYKTKLPDFDGVRWLENVPKGKFGEEYVSVNRSLRYRNPHFYYRTYTGNYPISFFGTKSEFYDFHKLYPFPNVIHVEIDNMLMAATLVLNSKYFVGNQSIGSALAQGLGHPQIQEFFPTTPNCMPKVTLDGQPLIKDWTITEDDFVVNGTLIFPEFKIPQ